MTEPRHVLDEARICGNSEMASLVRQFPWWETALGAIHEWPEALVTAVNLMLASPIPSTLYWGSELTIIYNDGYRLLMGSRHPEALGRAGAEVWREAWGIVRPHFEETLTTGVAVHNDALLVPIERDGEVRDRHWNHSISPVYDGGQIAGLYNTCTDVTAAVRAAGERDLLAQRLEQVMSLMSDGAFVLDREWRVRYMNRRALEATAAMPRLLGSYFWESGSPWNYDGSAMMHHFQRAMHEGTVAEFETYFQAPLDDWLRIRVSPTPEGVTFFMANITEAKRSEEEAAKSARALAVSEEELRWTVVLSSQMPWTADVYGNILWVDDRAHSAGGRSVARTMGDDWQRIVHAEDVEQSLAMWSHSMQTGTPYDREQRLRTSDGSYRWFRSRARPRRDDAGRIVKWYGTTEDIDLRKQTEDALLTSEKLAAVGRLASSIAHEINNPLEAVTNLLFLARTSDDVPAEALSYLETAERELKRVSTITSQTLRFHRQSTRQAEVELGALLDEVLSVVHGRLVNSQVTTELRLRTSGTTRCFEGEIRQVLLNLTVNAIDAMHGCGGGRLLLRAREGTDWRTGRRGVVVTVADTGPGMSAEVRERIFNPFFTTKGAAGTGLGLWVSQEIVARHLGALGLRTRTAAGGKERGHGCVFRLFLPEEAVDQPRRRSGDQR